MKAVGEFTIILGIIYGFHKLIGTEPNINSWWVQITLGAIVYSIGELRERAEKRKQEAETMRRMQEVFNRQEQWRKQRGK